MDTKNENDDNCNEFSRTSNLKMLIIVSIIKVLLLPIVILKKILNSDSDDKNYKIEDSNKDV